MLNLYKDFLYQLISTQASEKSIIWFNQKLAQFKNEPQTKNFYLTFAAIPRFVEKKSLHISQDDLQRANDLRKGFQPYWTIDQATRVLWLLHLPTEDESQYLKILQQILTTADVNELVALYLALPLLPFAASHQYLCAEGIRSNMTVVFEAVALHNPYPADYLEDNAWNQLFLKAIFTNKPIYKIYGIEDRSNAILAQTCSDYAHERWAAGREVSPELWRPVYKFLNDTLLEDMALVLKNPHPIQQAAAALVCWQSQHTKALSLLDESWKIKFESGAFLNWHEIGQAWEQGV